MLARGILIFVGAMALPGMVFAQPTDYSAGKTPAQLFSGDCSSCHQSPRGLAKAQDQRGLTNFLREHYTTRVETAGALAAYLLSNPGPAPAEARHPGEPRNRRATAAKPAPAAEGNAIIAPEPGAAEEKPARAAAKPPERGGKSRKQPPAAEAAVNPAAGKPEHERVKDSEKNKDAARTEGGKDAAAKAEAAKAEAARLEAAKADEAKAEAAKAEAAKAEAARVRAYATGGEEARPKESPPQSSPEAAPAEAPAAKPDAAKPDGETK